jgi:endonuclease/exonuclease/phosphatase family metal-dependent hydrolase
MLSTRRRGTAGKEGFPLGQNANDSKRRPGRLGRKPAILLSAVAVIALAIPAVADAKKKGKGAPKVTVMTRNLFLGGDLLPLTQASSIGEAIDLAGVVYNDFQRTKFQERVVPIAEEIKESKADLVGVQEASLWKKQEPSDGGAPPLSPIGTPATDVEQDFLALLEQELSKGSPKYEVVDVQNEFSGELPIDVDQSDATGTGPLAGFGADFDASLLIRDVILVRKGTKVKLGKIDSGNFTTVYQPNIGGIDLPITRGWVSVEAKVKGKANKKGKKAKSSKFRFINTHLEAYGSPTIREAQAKELIAGPLNTNKQVILVGDVNSGLQERHATGGYQFQPGDPLAFQALAAAGFKDNGAVKLNGPYPQTCCYSDLFDETEVFDHTVDHVLTNPGLKTKKAFVTGNDVSQRPSDLWPSDHGGKVTRLQLKK